jgi:hypothetical protein
MDESINDEDKSIVEKLRSLRISIDMQNAPLTAVVDHVREVSGLNIHISGIDNPDAEILSVKSRDEVLDRALRQILEPRNKTYLVRDGVVVITMADAVVQLRSVSEDGTKMHVTGKGIEKGSLLAVTRHSKFVALLRVEGVLEGVAEARALPGLAVGRILPGDEVKRIGNIAEYVSTLAEDVRKDLASRSNQQAIRAKMELTR